MVSPSHSPWKHTTLFPAWSGAPFRCVCIISPLNSMTLVQPWPLFTQKAWKEPSVVELRSRHSHALLAALKWPLLGFCHCQMGRAQTSAGWRVTSSLSLVSHPLSLDAPNQAIRLYSRHPRGIKRESKGNRVCEDRDTTDCFFVSPSLNPVISTTSSCLGRSRRRNHVWVEMVCPKSRNRVAALPLQSIYTIFM